MDLGCVDFKMSMRQLDIQVCSSRVMSSVKKQTQAPCDLSEGSDATVTGQGHLREQLE